MRQAKYDLLSFYSIKKNHVFQTDLYSTVKHTLFYWYRKINARLMGGVIKIVRFIC